MRVLSNGILAIFLLIPCLGTAQSKLVFSGIQGSVNSEISMRVLRRAYGRLGIEIEYLPLPGERALRTSDAGEVDGEVFRIANVHKRYRNLVPVPTSINLLQGIAFTRDRRIDIDGWQSLAPYHIGIQVGIKFAERGTESMRRIQVDTNEQLFKMLDGGRVEVVVAAHTNGLKTLSALGLNDIQAMQPAIQNYPLFHYLHAKHSALVPKLDAVLKDMEVSGEIRRIRETALEELRTRGRLAD